ncbi:hypothetical protein BB559_002610 [Furculomyces boomerangus]|uniref:Translation initiation factor eIF2B subunit gamma n=2 Tax=Harpellales TaxID=61421 RepID=A0A2T9YU06_9FUNG|nr:hypothetical protein BB559_002610 [Furculomyces boomerangus]PVZ98329.1 hypothetical protein BB558_005670 [Smittium angustum]
MKLYGSEIDQNLEFTAVVLAGPGTRYLLSPFSPISSMNPQNSTFTIDTLTSRLFPLSEPENYPKALIPIAMKPMIWYPLQWLESEGIQKIIIATTARDEVAISSYIHGVYEGSGGSGDSEDSASIEIFALEDFYGNADVLRQLSHRIKTDFIVTSTDAILDIPHSHYLDMFRLYKPDASCILMQENPSEGGGGCSRDDEVKRFYGVDQVTSKLVMIKDDNGEDDDIINVRMSIINQYPSISMSNNLLDLHVYVFQNWILEYINSMPEIMSIGYDLMPLLVKLQTQKKLVEKENISQLSREETKLNSILNNYQNDFDIHEHNGERDKAYTVSVLAYVRRGGIGGRANNINRYCDLNRVISKLHTFERISPSAEIGSKVQITNDSMVGASTKIQERSLIKKSVVGSHCIIGKNVKLTNCIINDHVTIEDNVKMESTVVCRQAKINAKSQLKDCEVGALANVPQNTNAKAEQFLRSNNELGRDGVQIKFT